MPDIQRDISLKPFTTFGVEAKGRYFASFNNINELKSLLLDPNLAGLPGLLLGGGSNILFTGDYEGLVMHNNIRGLEVLEEDDSHVVIRVGAGENWDDLVDYTVRQGWGGLENLSYIPGNVGASPIQNIGAYGTEVKELIEMVQTVNRENLMPVTYTNADCLFAYRDSIFKSRLKGKRVITHVVFRLSKNPSYNLDYGSLYERVTSKGSINLSTIRQSVIEIRRSKLPEPEETGSAGSFFKNPVITHKHYKKLQEDHPDLPAYPLEKKKHKIPAGWLIDKLGWKGHREGDAGVHEKQALVLVNHGNATGGQIYELSRKIKDSVRATFHIDLEYEVNIL
jgi:UDP-N-acetylmuramate dehydrogenase